MREGKQAMPSTPPIDFNRGVDYARARRMSQF
jgi:hypothetical protein